MNLEFLFYLFGLKGLFTYYFITILVLFYSPILNDHLKTVQKAQVYSRQTDLINHTSLFSHPLLEKPLLAVMLRSLLPLNRFNFLEIKSFFHRWGACLFRLARKIRKTNRKTYCSHHAWNDWWKLNKIYPSTCRKGCIKQLHVCMPKWKRHKQLNDKSHSLSRITLS